MITGLDRATTTQEERAADRSTSTGAKEETPRPASMSAAGLGILPVPLPTSSGGTTAHAAGLGERGRLRVKDERYSGKRRKRREHERGYHFCFFTDVFTSQGVLLRTQGTRRRGRRRSGRRSGRRRWWNPAVRAGVPKKMVQGHGQPDRTAADRKERRARAAVAPDRRLGTRKRGLQVRAPAREQACRHVSAHLDRIVSGCSRRPLMRYQLTVARAAAGWWCSAEVVRRRRMW
jgi:hypothetical protein